MLKIKKRGIHPFALSPAEIVGYLHDHDGKNEEDAGSQPFISVGVFGVEVTNVADGKRGDEPGEQQGNFSETKEQVRKDDRDDSENVTGGNGEQYLKKDYYFLEPGAWVIIFTASTISGSISAGNPMTISSSAIPENLLEPSQPREKFGLPVR